MTYTDLTDEDIDLAIAHMLTQGVHVEDVPRTQFGRRKAVEAYLRYEPIQPLSLDVRPWTPKNPTQPR